MANKRLGGAFPLLVKQDIGRNSRQETFGLSHSERGRTLARTSGNSIQEDVLECSSLPVLEDR